VFKNDFLAMKTFSSFQKKGYLLKQKSSKAKFDGAFVTFMMRESFRSHSL